MMRYLLLLLLVLISTVVLAQAVPNYVLDWDDNSEADLSHYIVYWRDPGGSYDPAAGIVATESRLEHLEQYVPYRSYIVVTAVDTSDNESGYSNEIFFDELDPPDVSPPNDPTGLHYNRIN